MGLGRGINFGGALDAVGSGAWEPGERHFAAVAAAGFDTVRLPVKWSAHAAEAAPYAIDTAFLARVDRAVDAALQCGLNVVVNVHHYGELCTDPEHHAPRFLALWRQIAARYADLPEQLCLELLNEVHGALTAERWNALLPQAVAVVRESDPARALIAGPARWNIVDALPTLALPADDRLIVTVHYYSPFRFTHQGAKWIEGADGWRGATWGTDADRRRVREDLERAVAWARERGRPLFVGEFGAHSNAAMDARAAWTEAVRSEAERLGVAWAYWDFATDFGAFDLRRGTWRAPLLRALIG